MTDMSKAPCLDEPDFWFPVGSVRSQTWRDDADLAKWICNTRCPIRQQCLAETLAAEQGRRAYSRYGIAGGLDPREREALDDTLPARTAA